MSISLQTYTNHFINLVSTAYPTTLAKGFAVIPAVAAIDCALTLIASFSQKSKLAITDADKRTYNFSANLGGAVFYGMCAAHVIPGSHYIGAAIYIIYSAVKCEKADSYVSAQLIGKVVKWPCTEIFAPRFNGIADMLAQRHPTWLATAILGGAALAHNRASLPFIGGN